MYSEIIKKITPKPQFNLKWYKDEDLYSEGDVEDTIIKLISENEVEKYTEAIYNNYNWSTYYHLTHMRKNILNWYPFESNSSVLEIGCGMGAITNMLCERCENVTAVELSKRRATATLLRCRDKENLEIIVGNLNDIIFEKKYDYITLIGVLEYQGAYTDSENPYVDFLKEIKKLLKPNGKLLIGIENKYGLKYWCGAREDHTGIPFDGMNQYTLTEKKIKTFSKKELEELILESGFQNSFFYYPMPDYKLPTVVYSEGKLPTNENMQNVRPYYVPDNATLIADEMGMYKDIIDNGVFEFFANSFLVECSDDNNLGEIVFANISSERIEKYRIVTRFTKEKEVQKIPLNTVLGNVHINQIMKNQCALQKHGIKVWENILKDNMLVSKYSELQLLEDKLVSLYKKKNETEIYKMFDLVYNEILNSSEHVSGEENILFSMNLVDKENIEKYGPILRIGYIDMILRNAFYSEKEIVWFDQEWILECVPVGYIFFRAIKEIYQSFSWMEKVIPIQLIAEKYNILSVWKEYTILEDLFFCTVADKLHFEESNIFRGVDRLANIKNIQKILSQGE